MTDEQVEPEGWIITPKTKIDDESLVVSGGNGSNAAGGNSGGGYTMNFKPVKTDKKELIWKKGKQTCVVLISHEEKTYQVALNNEQMKSLIFILPQLFDDHVIKVLEEPLDIGVFIDYERLDKIKNLTKEE